MPTLRAPKAIMAKLQPPEPRSVACLNCGTPLAGPFCSACGQRDIPPYPSVRELAIDAFWELSGWDGRFAATVRTLFTSPGALTRDFLEGRRARYLSPLRLYLMASLVYFVLAAAAPARQVAGTVDLGAIRIVATDPTAPTVPTAAGRVTTYERNAVSSQQPLSGAKRDSALASIAKAPRIFQPFLRRVVLDPAGFKRGLQDTMPRMLFALLPVFAAIVAIFYRKRKYPEHLYFAVHLHAFLFLALTIGVLARFTRSDPVIDVAQMIELIWIPVYATIAFRRTYGGTIGRTLLKELGIGFVYFWAGIAGLLATIYWVAVFS